MRHFLRGTRERIDRAQVVSFRPDVNGSNPSFPDEDIRLMGDILNVRFFAILFLRFPSLLTYVVYV